MDEAGERQLPEGYEGWYSRGTNQSGMRDLNERLVLSLVRQKGSLTKTEIAKLTMLSAQTVSVIVRALENDGLLVRNEPLRGKVGQPSVPMSLNPDGAYFLGLKIGRRSADLVLIDFLGNAKRTFRLAYRYPLPDEIVRFASAGVDEIRADFTSKQVARIAGLGIAMPFELWNWEDESGASRQKMEVWRQHDIRSEIELACGLQTYLRNDATSACGAELVFGRSPLPREFIYFYLGTFPGGGVVLNGTVFPGPTGNAGALGSMPVPGPDGRMGQLIDAASIAILEKKVQAAGRDSRILWESPEDWGELGEELDQWIECAAGGIAHTIVASCAVIDFQLAIVDGWMPAPVRARIVEAVSEKMGLEDSEGLKLPKVQAGTVGPDARAFGAATLPLSERFLYLQM
jgi:predicted NBD/HSP70 family sugar kinase